MPLTFEDFADFPLEALLLNIFTYGEIIRRGNPKDFINDYIDFCIELSEMQCDKDRYQNFNYVIQMLLHGKKFYFSNISFCDLHKIRGSSIF